MGVLVGVRGLVAALGWGTEPLHVLDRCRIRWGEVVQVADDAITVEVRRLTWAGRPAGRWGWGTRLHLGRASS